MYVLLAATNDRAYVLTKAGLRGVGKLLRPRCAAGVVRSSLRHNARIGHRVRRHLGVSVEAGEDEFLEFLTSKLSEPFPRLVVLERILAWGQESGLSGEVVVEDSFVEEARELDWIEVVVLDQFGRAVCDVSYELELPDGTKRGGRTDRDGRVRIEQVNPGTCQFRILEFADEDWG